MADRGRGTTVTALPPVRVKRVAELPEGVRDLASGNPDPALLPSLTAALARIEPGQVLYGGPAKLPELASLAAAQFADDGVDGDVAVTGGALDAMERALQTELRVGDRVVLEDPTWPRIADLVHALGLTIEPVPVDARGLDPARLEVALRRGARAVIATPRGQNPTGAAVDPDRGRALRAVLAKHPDVLVIEDDYVAWVAGADYVPVLADEATTVRELLVAGWAVSPGEPTASGALPAIRITTADLEPQEAERLADAIAALGRASTSTYAG